MGSLLSPEGSSECRPHPLRQCQVQVRRRVALPYRTVNSSVVPPNVASNVLLPILPTRTRMTMKRRRVSFKARVSVRQSRSPSPTLKMKSSLFYSTRELKGIALRAKAIANLKSMVDAPPHCVVGLGDEHDCFRGLESVVFPARRMARMLARKQVLKCHRLLAARDDLSLDRKELMLAKASSKITEWARRVSLETARIDSLRALCADYPIPVETIPVDVELTGLVYFKTKQRVRRQEYRGRRASS